MSANPHPQPDPLSSFEEARATSSQTNQGTTNPAETPGRETAQALAERSLIAAILADPAALDATAGIVAPDSFADEKLSTIYSSLLALSEEGTPIDRVTLLDHLERSDAVYRAGGRSFVAELSAQGDPKTAARAAPSYAAIVRSHATKRALKRFAEQVQVISRLEGDDAQALAEAERLLTEVMISRKDAAAARSWDLAASYLEDLDEAMEKGVRPGVQTGFHDLDRLTGGFQETDLIVVGARPGVGKSSFALSVVRNVAVKGKGRVLVFSLEMSKEQVVERLLAIDGGLDVARLRQKCVSDADLGHLMEAAARVAEADILVDDTPANTIQDMRSRARRLHREKPIDLIVVDYLQIATVAGKDMEPTATVKRVVNGLKLLAREIEVPVLALAQVNREVDKRQGHKHLMSDLSDSSEIEKAADLIAFLSRPGIYEDDDQPGAAPGQRGVEAALTIAKQRNGPQGQVPLAFAPASTAFTSAFVGTPLYDQARAIVAEEESSAGS